MEGPNYNSVGLDGRGVVMPDPSKAAVFFFSKPKEFPSESRAEGKPVWKNVDYVRVQQPGERDAVVLEATHVHKQRWPKQWEDYQAGKKSIPEGTLTSILFPGDEAIVLNLRQLGIYTVEQLAEMPDSATSNLPFGGNLKQKAIKYLELQNGAQGFNKLQAELQAKDEEIRSMGMKLQDLQEKFHQLAAERGEGASSSSGLSPEQVQQMIAAALAATQTPKRGPGRPPKEN